MAILSVRNIQKQFGAIFALDDVSVDFNAGEVVAVLGDNGAGKSTLIKVMVQELRGRDMAVIYITHNTHDVMAVCDRCVIMKNGRSIGEVATSDVSRDQLANMIITGDMKPSVPVQSRASV
jgi:ABC-type sugar transport system ATPase subunit